MNVNVVQTGRVHTLLNAVTTAAAGSTYLKPSTMCTFQADGTTSAGTGAATIEVQVSNNDSNWEVAGTISLTLGTTSVSDGFVFEAPWKYVRGEVTAISGTNATVTLTMGV